MDARASRFRKKANEENQGRTGVRRRYSEKLRVEAVNYLRHRQTEGASLNQIGEELGLNGWSLTRWSRDRKPGKRFRRVELSEARESTANGLTLVTPDGFRVEGLCRDEVREVVESLR